MTLYDVAIIGGGINGCGVAADAATRGLSVFLCEEGDIAGETSSNSSKLIHGGLRYLENYNLSLVKKSLDEQQTLIEIAPHLISPLPFILVNSKTSRSIWKLRIGLFIYNHLSKINSLPKKKYINRIKNPHYFNPLFTKLKNGFIYYDCKTDDARLTITNALQAKKHGAKISLHSKLIKAKVIDKIWHLTISSKQHGIFTIKAKSLVNAAGPWVEEVNKILFSPTKKLISLVQGSHIVVNKLYEGEHAYLLQNSDKRIIFVTPYNGYSMVGTTEKNCIKPTNKIAITNDEIDYLITSVNNYFHTTITKKDILNTWSGIRVLLEKANKNSSNLSRDYFLQYNEQPAPHVTIYGGKITTYRRLASEAIDKLQNTFPYLLKSKTNIILLPGAEANGMNLSAYKKYASTKYSWLKKENLNYYLTTYGTLTENILKNCQTSKDLGISFHPLLYQAEIDYLIKEEWATNIDDILWRRTKLGLKLNNQQQQHLTDYIKRTIKD